MSAKPQSLDQLTTTVENHEKRLQSHSSKLDAHDHQLRGPEGIHTQVALIKRELAQIIWLGKIIIVALVGLFISDLYRTVKSSQHERAMIEQIDKSQTAEKPVTQLRRTN